MQFSESTTIELFESYAQQFDIDSLLQRIREKEDQNKQIKHHPVCKYNARTQLLSTGKKQNPRKNWHKKRDAHKLACKHVCSFVSNKIIVASLNANS